LIFLIGVDSMLEAHIKNIMESKSIERLEGFPMDEIEHLLHSFPNVTNKFFTPIVFSSLFEHLNHVEAEEGRYLQLGAQLNNTLVTPAPGPILRWWKGRNPPGPEDYVGLVENIDKKTRNVLLGSKRFFLGDLPTSYSVVGTITDVRTDLDDRLLRKRTPLLLVPHEVSPEIGRSDYGILRHNGDNWSRIDESMYNQAIEKLNMPAGLGYIS
jgi:hypothetical protein